MRMLKRLVACAGVVVAVAGCAAAGTTTPKVSGGTLTIFLSAPSGALSSQYADVVDAARLAFDRAGHSVGRFQLQLRVVHRTPSDNARTAIEDSSAIAYLGELAPGSSADSVGITDAQDLLQVGATDTALELTRATPAVPGAPDDYYESLKTYGRTFARVVPTTASEARAQAMEMRSLGVHKVYVADDGSAYGRAIAHAVAGGVSAPMSAVQGRPSASRVIAANADAVFFGSSSSSQAVGLFNAVAASSPRTKLLAPSALYDDAFVARLSAAARRELYVSSPGFLNGHLPAAARSQFVVPFEAAYHRQPEPQAIFGYEAVAALLSVLHQAGSAVNQRVTVVRDFMVLHRASSVIGSYSINRYGDPTTAPFVIARVKGAALQPYRFEQVGG
ncbi:MAG: ABC transporter substrate-binding protein [Solirubrobacterales bacterium]|nr:ABC transporter substrate-binding protein [Solirubrobacterales bacterium]